ncbi:MAG: hypothetical protein Q9216_004740 [Gyalolechia sp. 2 TL-2023]
MAAQSRLALRSSRRGSVGLGELPATVIQRNPSPANTRKRTRDPSIDRSDRKSSKTSHDDAENTFTRRITTVYSTKTSSKNAPTPALREAVTQDAIRPCPPPARSTPVAQNAPHDPTIVDDERCQSPNASLSGTKANLTVDKTNKRSLRSHDGGSRFKSELALYFADYDEILGDVPKTQEFLTPATRMYIVDELFHSPMPSPVPAIPPNKRDVAEQPAPTKQEPTLSGDLLLNSGRRGDEPHLNNAERLDFASAERHARQITEDPLTDQLYCKAHRRAERGEKSHRNREKESAQHEKSQLERILVELKGHGWLKTMGISGITDSEKKVYEPKRTVFIQRVTALLDKFRAWKEEEKRRKFERERASTVDEEEEEAMESIESESPGGFDGVDERNGSSRAKRNRQRDTASARTGPSASSKRVRLQTLKLLPLPVEKPFTSFYAKPYLRDAALSKHRRGRLRFAFGQQIPELEEREFELPSEMLTSRFIAANARSRRAARREGRGD